jgi:ABC-type transporter Mla maintaining outer membrane lipid asymmetry ATPase subunit MlaF
MIDADADVVAPRNNTELGDRAMLEMTDVTKAYRIGGQTVRALDSISLTLTGGEFVSVVGPSGAGKSTLLHLLGALDTPDSGSIRFQRKEIGDLNDDQQSEFRRHSVGFVFQFFNLLPTMTAWENVACPSCSTAHGWRGSSPVRWSCFHWSGSVIARSTGRRSCPADRCSGLPLPGR